jgi:phage-related protein
MALKVFDLFGEINLKGGQQVDRDLDAVDKRAGKTGSSIGSKISKGAGIAGKALGTLTIAAGAAIVAIGKSAYENATALEATQAKFETVFGDYQSQMLDTIDEFQKLTPATQAAAQSMASGIQDLLVPMGFARDEATGMTADTLHLVGALTNFNSATHSAEDVAGAFQAALTGEYESLKRLGIQVNATTVKQKAMEMGLADANGEISNAAEAQALLQLATEQSTDALDAYNEESLDTKTKVELMKTSFQDLFAEVGQALIPTFDDLLDTVRQNMPTIKDTITSVMNAVIPIIDSLSKTVLPAVMDLLPLFADVFTDVVAPAIDELLPLFTQIIEDLLPPFIELFGEIAETILPPVVNILKKVFEALTPVLDVVMSLVADTVLPLLNSLFEALDPILDSVLGLLDPLLGALQPIFDLLANLAQDIMPILNPLFEALAPLIDALKPALEALKVPLAIISDALGIIVATIKWIIDGIGYILGMNDYQDFSFDFNNTATMAAINSYSAPKVTAPSSSRMPTTSGGGSMSISARTGFAEGGYVETTDAYLVGERGPEVVQLPAGANVINNEDTQRLMRGGDTYNIYAGPQASPIEIIRQAEKQSALRWAMRSA